MDASKNSGRFPRPPPATVSVVIPVRNGADLLPKQLGALAKQDCGYEWEIVVVDNGSTDGTAHVAMAWRDRLPIRIVAALEKPGVSYARNIGLRSARGDLIVFCDADDEVSEGWLGAVVEAALESDAVGGSTDLARLNDPGIGSWNSLALTTRPRLAGGFLPAVGAGNMCVWGDVLVALEGFNEEFESGAEDIDFCWRLQLAGFRLGFSQQALVHVRSRNDLRGLARQFYRYGKESPHLFRRFRSVGMPRSSFRGALKSWAWLAIRSPDLLRGRSYRGNWIRGAAMRAGKIVGSLRNRTVYL